MKKCLGPCVGQANRDEYQALVRSAVAFLDGDDDIMFQAIWKELETAAEKLNFERARKLRNNLQTLRSIVDAHQLLRKADERPTLVLAQPGPDACQIEVMLRSRRAVGGPPFSQCRANARARWPNGSKRPGPAFKLKG